MSPLPALLPNEPLWQENDAAALREVLSKHFGQQLLRRLLFSRPLVTSYDREQRNIQSDERAGFEACIAEILRLAESQPAPSP